MKRDVQVIVKKFLNQKVIVVEGQYRNEPIRKEGLKAIGVSVGGLVLVEGFLANGHTGNHSIRLAAGRPGISRNCLWINPNRLEIIDAPNSPTPTKTLFNIEDL